MSEKLLIVEDDEAIANILKEHLEKEGYKVIWSSSGKEGLEDFKNEKFQLVMIDLMLPEMDGFHLSKNIRWIDEEIPILIISARQSDTDKVKALKLGADDYITKPFSLLEITARIEAHLRRYRKKEGIIIASKSLDFHNGLSIIFEENIVLLQDTEVSLTSKEYNLLYLMAQNPNRVFSKEELYEHIWNNLDMDGNNTVTVHIKALREKLKDNIKSPIYIQTVWGTGYKFIGEKKL